MIMIVPEGGMGNRLRSICSAAQLSADTNQKLYIIWCNDKVCCCNFEDVIIRLKGIDYEVKNVLCGPLRKSVFSVKWWRYLRAKIYKCNYKLRRYKNIFINTCKLSNEDVSRISLGNKSFISSCYNFYGNSDYTGFEFCHNIVKKVDDLMGGYENVVGIHIRRGDMYWAEQESPLEMFVKKMEQIIREDFQVVFFIATDDKDVLKYLIKKIPERCIYYTEKSWDRYSYDGQISGLMELLCLSRTNKIYGTSGSSYCDEAAKIGRIEKVTIGKEI